MKIIVFGASGTGTSTLAASLAVVLKAKHLDVDDYYWVRTKVPFQLKIPLAERQQKLRQDFDSIPRVVVSGSLVTWNAYWNSAFDFAVFLTLPSDLRMERLRQREEARYGVALQNDEELKQKSEMFLAWAKEYDDVSFDGRSITQHRNWIELLSCNTIEITGDYTNQERLNIVLDSLAEEKK